MPRKPPEPVETEPTEEEAFLSEKLAGPVKVGRKPKLNPDEDTIRTISELAKLFCTQAEIASVLGVSERTLQNFLYSHQDANDAWQDGLQRAKISLRRKQLALADKNAPVAIFLGKNYLGQKDEHHSTTTVNKPAQDMSEDELLEIAKRGTIPQAPKVDKSKAH